MLRGEKLGEGTFGIVYSARSPNSKKEYAIKRNLADTQKSFISTPREVDVLTKLRLHPNICRLEYVSFGEPFKTNCFSPLDNIKHSDQRNDSIHFIFKKANYDLHNYIYGVDNPCFRSIKKYMVDIILGLEYMHGRKIIHRDLKPSNILIFQSEPNALGIPNVAKICDFGLAKPFTYQGIQTPKLVTAWYRAPEITLGYPYYDYKSDVWSLGCVLFEMVYKEAFIYNVPDDDDIILSAILGSLPIGLSVRELREMVKINTWRPVKLTPIHSPKTRMSFVDKIKQKLTDKTIAQFEREAGSIQLFDDLLNKCLTFNWEQRIKTSEILNHPFFEDYHDYVKIVREKYPIEEKSNLIIIKQCIERKWMSEVVFSIFNNRVKLDWYSHRVLFQAMDLFDRYLLVMFHVNNFPSNAIESDFKGLIHDKFGTELRFMTCLYLCIKYFSSIHYPVSFDSIVGEEYKTTEAKLQAEQFEAGFIKNCLEYNIYRPTLYEAADEFNDKLGDKEIGDLIVLYTSNYSVSGMTHQQLYSYYREHLRGQSLENMKNVNISH